RPGPPDQPRPPARARPAPAVGNPGHRSHYHVHGIRSMNADAFTRARKLLADRGVVTTVAVLGVVSSLLVLGLLTVVGLLTALIDSRGEARFPTDRKHELRSWISARETGVDQDDTLYEDTGLLPVATGNLHSPNPLHQLGARAVLWLTNRVETLRNNV